MPKPTKAISIVYAAASYLVADDLLTEIEDLQQELKVAQRDQDLPNLFMERVDKVASMIYKVETADLTAEDRKDLLELLERICDDCGWSFDEVRKEYVQEEPRRILGVKRERTEAQPVAQATRAAVEEGYDLGDPDSEEEDDSEMICVITTPVRKKARRSSREVAVTNALDIRDRLSTLPQGSRRAQNLRCKLFLEEQRLQRFSARDSREALDQELKALAAAERRERQEEARERKIERTLPVLDTVQAELQYRRTMDSVKSTNGQKIRAAITLLEESQLSGYLPGLTEEFSMLWRFLLLLKGFEFSKPGQNPLADTEVVQNLMLSALKESTLRQYFTTFTDNLAAAKYRLKRQNFRCMLEEHFDAIKFLLEHPCVSEIEQALQKRRLELDRSPCATCEQA